jgi:hypothetical protein
LQVWPRRKGQCDQDDGQTKQGQAVPGDLDKTFPDIGEKGL